MRKLRCGVCLRLYSFLCDFRCMDCAFHSGEADGIPPIPKSYCDFLGLRHPGIMQQRPLHFLESRAGISSVFILIPFV